MPSPETCCDSASPTVKKACSNPNTMPVSAATPTPAHSGAPAYTASQPVKAPATMIPSMPRLSTPARSHSSTPSVPRMSGVAMRSTATQKAGLERMSSRSVISSPARGTA
ncbi:hypothetical protein D3C86_475040 [compost metagenome]